MHIIPRAQEGKMGPKSSEWMKHQSINHPAKIVPQLLKRESESQGWKAENLFKRSELNCGAFLFTSAAMSLKFRTFLHPKITTNIQ